jgi:hypothetical protein
MNRSSAFLRLMHANEKQNYRHRRDPGGVEEAYRKPLSVTRIAVRTLSWESERFHGGHLSIKKHASDKHSAISSTSEDDAV